MNEEQLTASLGGGRGLPRLGDELDVDVLRQGGEGELYCTVLYCTVLYLRQGGEGDLQPADRVLVRVLLLCRVAEVHRGVRSLQIFLFVVKIFSALPELSVPAGPQGRRRVAWPGRGGA